MTPEQKIEAIRAEFEERFKLDIWPVVDWLRNKGAVHMNAPEPGISPDFHLLSDIEVKPTTIPKTCSLKALMLATALQGRSVRLGAPPGAVQGELGNSFRALVQSAQMA